MTHRSIIRLLALALLAAAAMLAQNSVSAPATVNIGSSIEISITGSTGQRDFVTIVKKGTAEGKYDHYQYPRGKPTVKLDAPDMPGDYEIRLLAAASPYKTLARKPITVTDVNSALDAPTQVEAGAAFDVRWTGPGNPRDFVSITKPGDAKQRYVSYRYTSRGNPAKMRAPDEAGTYELRYLTGQTYRILSSRKLVVGAAEASITAPAQVMAGADFDATWSGPDNQRDFITIVAAGAPEKSYKFYQYTSRGNPAKMRAPDTPGDYEVRYSAGQSYMTLARASVKVLAVGASVDGPAAVTAGSLFEVRWKGPDNRRDFITIVEKGAREREYGHYAYTNRGNPVTIKAPTKAGEYELRYSTGQTYATLARASIRVTPGEQEPGALRVIGASTAGSGSRAGGGGV
ncbi:MAG: hypothetical protein GY953_12185 [bacterium]|nr:hypothetical protein [bacterium]